MCTTTATLQELHLGWSMLRSGGFLIGYEAYPESNLDFMDDYEEDDSDEEDEEFFATDGSDGIEGRRHAVGRGKSISSKFSINKSLMKQQQRDRDNENLHYENNVREALIPEVYHAGVGVNGVTRALHQFSFDLGLLRVGAIEDELCPDPWLLVEHTMGMYVFFRG